MTLPHIIYSTIINVCKCGAALNLQSPAGGFKYLSIADGIHALREGLERNIRIELIVVESL